MRGSEEKNKGGRGRIWFLGKLEGNVTWSNRGLKTLFGRKEEKGGGGEGQNEGE